MTERWLNGPVGKGTPYRVSRHGCRTVLVVVPFMAAGTRLMDVLSLLEADHRITTVFTVVPGSDGAGCHGAEEFLRAHACLVLPWRHALQYEFDLVLAASPRGLAELRGRSVLLPHGECTAAEHALDRESLMNRGRVVPHVLGLSHDSTPEVLAESCPEAVPVATVVGDICYDRLLASIPFRARYRKSLGLSKGQKLVVVTSTWLPGSTLGSRPELVARVVDELPTGRFQVAVIINPNAWSVHGGWQIRAWLADCLDGGALLVPPDEGWRAALIAADLVVGDYGSVTRYGAAIGLPTMVAASPEELRPDPVTDLLRQHASLLREDHPLPGQMRTAMVSDRSWQDVLAARITSRPGRAGEILRKLLYRALDLAEPDREVPCLPVPLPRPVAGTTRWWKDACYV